MINIINLKRRTDRWSQCEKNLSPYFQIQRFEGVDGREHRIISNQMNNGSLHCTISHIMLLESLLEKDDDVFLIGEDDLEITDYGNIEKCIQEFKQLNYDVCNIGFDRRWMPTFGEQHEFIQGIVSGPTLTTHFYLVKKVALSKLIKALKYCAESVLKGASHFTHGVDWAWSFPQFNISRCVPKIDVCKQYTSKSDIALQNIS